MSNGCPSVSMDDNNGTPRNPSETELESNERKQSESDEPSSMEEDSMSNAAPTTSSTTTTEGNPFVEIIDRNSESMGTQEKDNTSTSWTSVEASRSTNGLGFQPEFVTPGPNPIRIPPDDFMTTLVGFKNMYLAHEICINPEFKLERFVPPPDSLEFRIQHHLKRAFWDLLDEQLTAQPPNYNQALSIFEEMKTMLLSLLMPHNHSMRQRINEVLDVDLIRQQVQNDALDFGRYADFIVSILGQLCAPSRDEEIAALRQLTRPTEIFQGILEVMEKMKLDMANFYVQQFRPEISQNCLQYERKKFADFLDLEFRLKEDGLRNARKWLLSHRIENRDTNMVIIKAFSEILWWTGEKKEWPETLALDANRLTKLANSIKRLGLVGGIVLTSETVSQPMLARPAPELRSVLKTQLASLISDEDILNDVKLAESLDRVAEQVVKVTGDVVNTQSGRILDDTEKDTIRHAIRDLVREDHKLRNLLVRRTVEFAESWLVTGKINQQVIPSGLYCISPEITSAMKDFHKVVEYNRAVFDRVYVIIVEDKTPVEDLIPWAGVEASLETILKALARKDLSKSTQGE